ncbi:MAG: sulfate-transporting ATPase, partial [Stygiobacter sp.]
MNALEIKSITKKFGEIVAVDDVSLSIAKGEMFALVGPDGVGKTTIIRMLCGIVKPNAG